MAKMISLTDEEPVPSVVVFCFDEKESRLSTILQSVTGVGLEGQDLSAQSIASRSAAIISAACPRARVDVVVETVSDVKTAVHNRVVSPPPNAELPDMAVFGCRGLSVVKGIVVGSVTLHAASHALVPILVVKSPIITGTPNSQKRPRMPPPLPTGAMSTRSSRFTIVCAVDRSKGAAAAARFAARLVPRSTTAHKHFGTLTEEEHPRPPSAAPAQVTAAPSAEEMQDAAPPLTDIVAAAAANPALTDRPNSPLAVAARAVVAADADSAADGEDSSFAADRSACATPPPRQSAAGDAEGPRPVCVVFLAAYYNIDRRFDHLKRDADMAAAVAARAFANTRSGLSVPDSHHHRRGSAAPSMQDPTAGDLIERGVSALQSGVTALQKAITEQPVLPATHAYVGPPACKDGCDVDGVRVGALAVKTDHIRHGLVDACRAVHADVVVLGRSQAHMASEVSGVVLGSVAQHFLASSNVPAVVICPP